MNATLVPFRDFMELQVKRLEDRIEALRLQHDERFRSGDKAVEAALGSTREAIHKAEIATEKRFDSVNEFRSSLSDQSRLMMPRTEAEQAHRAVIERVDELSKRINAREEQGKGMHQGWLILIAAFSLLGSIISTVIMLSNLKR